MKIINLYFVHGWGFSSDFWLPSIEKLRYRYKSSLNYYSINLGFLKKVKIYNISNKQNIKNIFVLHSYGYNWFLKEKILCDGIICFNSSANFFFKKTTRKSRLITNMISDFKINPEKVLRKFYRLCNIKDVKFNDLDLNKGNLLRALQDLSSIDYSNFEKKISVPQYMLNFKDDRVLGFKDNFKQNSRANLEIKILDRGTHAFPLNNPENCAKFIKNFLINNDFEK